MTVLGKYEIIEQLRVGSMGTVYRARDTVLDREVALKTILAKLYDVPETKERFFREARACARLQHPHIVTVYDFGEADHTAYISMELLMGEDLRRTIETRRDIPLETKLEVIAQVADALDHAHNSAVIHRDIKPSNIFLNKDGQAKVLDFGIARLESSKLTMVGRVLGTPNYMAPEQIRGQVCDARSDLFSLAVVLCEFLTGVHPFQSEYIPRSIVNVEAQPLRNIDPTLPQSLEDFMTRALQKLPEGRFQTASEFSRALRSVSMASKQAAEPRLAARAEAPFVEHVVPNVAATQGPPVVPATPSDQTVEFRISEFFRLMQDCDSALRSRQVDKAEAVLREMKGLAGVDTRFKIAVSDYERQVDTARGRTERTATPERYEEKRDPTTGGLRSSSAGIESVPSPAAPSYPSYTEPPARQEYAAPERASAQQPFTPQQPFAPQQSFAPAQPVTPPQTFAPQEHSAPTPDPAAFSGGEVTRLFSTPKAAPEKPAPTREADRPAASAVKVDQFGVPQYGDRISDSDVTGTGIKAQILADPPMMQPSAPVAPSTANLAAPAKSATSANQIVQQPPQAKSMLQMKLLIVGSGVLVLAALIGLAIFLTNKPKQLPSVGSAVVSTIQLPVFPGPNGDEREVAVMHKGERVNVTRLPRSANPEWIAVQPTGDGFGPPGYARSSGLTRWSTLALVELFDPGDAADTAQQSAYIDTLQRALPAFGTSDQNRAWLEIARKNIALARAKKVSGASAEDWQTQIVSARNALEKISSEPSLAADARGLEQELTTLAATPVKSAPTTQAPSAQPASTRPSSTQPPTSTPSRPARVYNSSADYAAANDAYRNGDYATGITTLRKILSMEPGNAAARKLLDKVQKAKQEEDALSNSGK